MEQLNLFKAKRVLVLKADPVTSDDPLEAFLLRQGWELRRVAQLQESIFQKCTIDMFSGETPLNASEVQLQADIDQFLRR